MKESLLLRRIEQLELNARIMLNTASALKKELSGGSDSSVSTKNHIKRPAEKRREKLIRMQQK